MPKKRWPFVVVLLTGLLCALPGLEHDYWHDEIYTLTNFAIGWREALLDYHAPNNHRLFSLLLCGWLKTAPLSDLLDIPRLRVVPLAFFLIAAVGVTTLAGRRGGRTAALLAGTLFVAWHPTLCVATELRGYSLSWVFALWAATALDAWWQRPRRRDFWSYLAACWLGTLTLPTFLLVPAALAAWLAREYLAHEGTRGTWRRRKGELLATGLGPLIGLLTYLPCARQMAGAAAQGSTVERNWLLWHWPWALGKDLLWLAPFLLFAAVGAIRHDGRERRAWRFTAATFIVPFALALALPRPPNDRVLATVLPLLAVGMGTLTAAGIRRLARMATRNSGGATATRRGRAWAGALAAVMAGMALLHMLPGMANPLAITVPDENWCPEPHDIYDQWYHYGYHLIAAATSVTADCQERPGMVIIERSDPFSLLFYFALLRNKGQVDAVWLEKLRKDPEKLASHRAAARHRTLYLMAPTRGEANAMAAAFGRQPPRLWRDYGYCQVFRSPSR